MTAKIAPIVAAIMLACGGVVAKLAHLGPFADNVIQVSDTAAMTSLAFHSNYQAMRSGTLPEKQAVEVACALFTSVATTGSPPPAWLGFESALEERTGVTDSTQFLTGKVGQLNLAVEMAERNPRFAAAYARSCML
jgi:hypothetical protein